MNQITGSLPVIVRYAITILASLLVGAGWITETDLPSALQDQIVTAILALIAVVPAIYAIIKRPSPKALEAAKAVDAELPKAATVVIQTPGGQPDIIIPAKQ